MRQQGSAGSNSEDVLACSPRRRLCVVARHLNRVVLCPPAHLPICLNLPPRSPPVCADTHLHFLLEYCSGGELYALLNAQPK